MTDEIRENNNQTPDTPAVNPPQDDSAFDDDGFADRFFAEDDEYRDITVEKSSVSTQDENEIINPKALETKAVYRQKLLDTYKKIFQTETFDNNPSGLIAKAHYSERTVKGKFAFMQSERNEYVYIYDIDKLTADVFADAANFSWENGIETIQPVKGYLSSFITVVILANKIDDESIMLINKHRMLKNLKRQKMGIVNQRICGVDFSSETAFCNKDSKELGVFLQKFFSAIKTNG